ncbi:MAG TPA: hypothetical protein VF728_08405 [Nocardioides sp.]
MTTRPTRISSRAVARTAEDGPEEMSGVLMLVTFLLVLSVLGYVAT